MRCTSDRLTLEPASRRACSRPAPREGAAISVRPHGRGFAAEAPGFYVWDEDRDEALRIARELERAAPGASRPGGDRIRC